MFAIFLTAGKQYKVQINDEVYVEKINLEKDKEVIFEQVLMIDNKIGKPYLQGAKVICQVEKQGKQKKIATIKHLPQKHHNRKKGHRQLYTKLLVKNIIYNN